MDLGTSCAITPYVSHATASSHDTAESHVTSTIYIS